MLLQGSNGLICRMPCGSRLDPNKVLRLAQLILALSVGYTPNIWAAGPSLTFGGVTFSPGSMVRANVPLSALEKSYAGQGGNAVPPSAVATLVTPANFDPRKTWPVLIPNSSSDNKYRNGNETWRYRKVGLAEGWVLLAGDEPQFPRNDVVAWRAAMTLAAVDALHRSFPGSEKWPIACAGQSGGGKGIGYIAPFLAKNGCRIIGIYIEGTNEDHLSDGYRRIQPGANFLSAPIYISAGRDDPIAPVHQQYAVAGSIKRTGFNRVRIETFRGGHEVNDAQTSTALRWFRELAK
jgi:hypothetical protein